MSETDFRHKYYLAESIIDLLTKRKKTNFGSKINLPDLEIQIRDLYDCYPNEAEDTLKKIIEDSSLTAPKFFLDYIAHKIELNKSRK
jgi:hypothetical protein